MYCSYISQYCGGLAVINIGKLSWIINNACNLRCVHCYPDSGIETISMAIINKIWPKEVAPMCSWRIIYLGIMFVTLLAAAYIPCRIELIFYAITAILAFCFQIFIIIKFSVLDVLTVFI